MIDKKRRN